MSRNPSEVTEPSVRQLCQALGVPELRCGRQALRDQRGWLDDQIDVGYLWHALVMPSFHPWAAVGMAHMDESEFRGKKHPSVIRGAVVLFDRGQVQMRGWGAADVGTDPLAEAIRGVQLLPAIKSICLDGISYRICTSDYEINATLEIHNPRTASLRAVEQSLFQVAKSVQEQTGNDEIAAYLNSWQECIGR